MDYKLTCEPKDPVTSKDDYSKGQLGTRHATSFILGLHINMLFLIHLHNLTTIYSACRVKIACRKFVVRCLSQVDFSEFSGFLLIVTLR